MSTHEFAIFCDPLPSSHEPLFIITDAALIHRLTRVLRLRQGEHCTLFSRTHYARAVLVACDKKTCTTELSAISPITPLQPAMHWFVPLLEREDFATALYALSVHGATTITPFLCAKSRKKWGTEKDFERASKIMIAAAEQSKQFALPQIAKPRTLEQLIPELGTYHTIFFDPDGTMLTDELERHWTGLQTKPLGCIVGPEGGLNTNEEKLLRFAVAATCRLTQSILKACDAVALAAGIVRTLLQ